MCRRTAGAEPAGCLESPDAHDPTAKAQLQIHVCVLLWGFTAILGKLITLPALPLVWWRMLIVVAALAAGAARVARPARDVGAAALVVRRHRRAGGAALADVLRLDQAVERVGRRDLHRAGDGVHRAARTVAGAHALLPARPRARHRGIAGRRAGGRRRAARDAAGHRGRRAVGAAGRVLRLAQQAPGRARRPADRDRDRTRRRHARVDRAGAGDAAAVPGSSPATCWSGRAATMPRCCWPCRWPAPCCRSRCRWSRCGT